MPMARMPRLGLRNARTSAPVNSSLSSFPGVNGSEKTVATAKRGGNPTNLLPSPVEYSHFRARQPHHGSRIGTPDSVALGADPTGPGADDDHPPQDSKGPTTVVSRSSHFFPSHCQAFTVQPGSLRKAHRSPSCWKNTDRYNDSPSRDGYRESLALGEAL